jgi:hypothetical protein
MYEILDPEILIVKFLELKNEVYVNDIKYIKEIIIKNWSPSVIIELDDDKLFSILNSYPNLVEFENNKFKKKDINKFKNQNFLNNNFYNELDEEILESLNNLILQYFTN